MINSLIHVYVLARTHGVLVTRENQIRISAVLEHRWNTMLLRNSVLAQENPRA